LACYVVVRATRYSGHDAAPPARASYRLLRTAYRSADGTGTRGANRDSRHPSSRDVSQACYQQNASDDVRGRSRDVFERWES
jgi:hypothetical protein